MAKQKLNFILLFFLLCVVFFACSSHPSNSTVNSPGTPFKAFLKKFTILSYPVILNKVGADPSKKLNDKDNVFIKSEYPNEIYSYGMLPDTMDTFKIIWLAPGDDYFPILTTFSKSGKKINEERIGVGECGVDCCYQCNEFITIKKDLTIFSIDSIKSCECDSTGPKENTMTKSIRYRTGRILKGGKIQMTDTKSGRL